jgi:hypothetical protein
VSILQLPQSQVSETNNLLIFEDIIRQVTKAFNFNPHQRAFPLLPSPFPLPLMLIHFLLSLTSAASLKVSILLTCPSPQKARTDSLGFPNKIDHSTHPDSNILHEKKKKAFTVPVALIFHNERGLEL